MLIEVVCLANRWRRWSCPGPVPCMRVIKNDELLSNEVEICIEEDNEINLLKAIH
jgi:hypothetical protein